MDTMSVPTHLHNLNDKWDMYYHLPHDKNWSLDSYSTIHKGINNVETIIKLNDTIHDNVIKNCMMFIMRNGITHVGRPAK